MSWRETPTGDRAGWFEDSGDGGGEMRERGKGWVMREWGEVHGDRGRGSERSRGLKKEAGGCEV